MRQIPKIFSHVKVFCATTFGQRAELEARVNHWFQTRRGLKIVDLVVRQSSDKAYHCLSIVVFYVETANPRESRR